MPLLTVGGAIWLRQIVRRKLCKSMDLDGNSQLRHPCSILTVKIWAEN
jgi:hypothetical protein